MAEKTELGEEACARLEDARRQKTEFDQDLREGYWFAAPHRARNVSSRTRTTQTKPKDAEFLNTSFAFEMAGDFATVIMNTFMPEGQPWAVRRAGMLIPQAARDDLEKQALTGDKTIFDAIAGSNFYAECGKGFRPDLALGLVGMWCDVPKAHEPLKFQSVPIREIEVNVGPDGTIDDRFVVRHTKFRHLKALLKGVDLGSEVETKIKDPTQRDKECQVVWGFWRLYDADEETWQHLVMVDDKIVGKPAELKGPGSCPLVIGRFNPSVEWAWAIGPLIEALPDLRVVDDLAVKKMKLIGRMMDGPCTIPERASEVFEEGIEDGALYPIPEGTEDTIRQIYEIKQQDPAIFFTQDLEARIKRLFFLDYPDQSGKTPPTATQWLDEMTMAQRRIGTPGLAFWDEFCRGTFLRVQYILEKQGVIKPLEVNGKTVSLLPYNPTQQAYEQQRVAQFTRFAGISAQMFPEEWKLHTDGGATMSKLASTMGVNELWQVRKPADVEAAIQHIQALTSGQAPGAPQVPSSPPVPQPDVGAPAPSPVFKATLGGKAA